MKYTERIHNTIDLVSSLHANQKRKGSDTPYVSHCFGVAFILSNYTSDEDIIIAGLLHDVTRIYQRKNGREIWKKSS